MGIVGPARGYIYLEVTNFDITLCNPLGPVAGQPVVSGSQIR